MKAKIKDNVICECGTLMRLRQKKHEEGQMPIDYLACQNKECKHYGVSYKLPSVEIEELNKPAVDATTQVASILNEGAKKGIEVMEKATKLASGSISTKEAERISQYEEKVSE